jgi:MYXO-CTERM domain-containing protein
VKNIALLVIAGLATGAVAQGVTLNFTANASEVNVGDTISWTVSASFTGYPDPSAYYGGFVGTFDASDLGLGTAQNFVNLMAGTGTPAAANGASVTAVNIFNAALLQTNDPANPIDIFTFDVVAGSVGVLSYNANGTSTVFPNDGIFTLGEEAPTTTSSASVNIVPAPGAAALLGLGGLVAARRRR